MLWKRLQLTASSDIVDVGVRYEHSAACESCIATARRSQVVHSAHLSYGPTEEVLEE